MALRRELWRRGLRYRVDVRPLPHLRRRADLVFSRARVAVFVDGCFWHVCPRHGSNSKVNQSYWSAKLARNVERDRETDAALTEEGWLAVRVWEHEDFDLGAARIEALVRYRASLCAEGPMAVVPPLASEMGSGQAAKGDSSTMEEGGQRCDPPAGAVV